MTQLNHEGPLSRSAPSRPASPLLHAIAYKTRKHSVPKDKPKLGVETLRDHQKKRNAGKQFWSAGPSSLYHRGV